VKEIDEELVWLFGLKF